MTKYLLLALTMAATIAACGSDENLQRVEVPELSIEDSDGFYNIELPTVDDKPLKQNAIIKVRNTGKAPLKVTRLEWVAKPDRLFALGAAGSSCETDAQCGEDELCLSSSCFALGLPATPFEVEPALRRDFEFVISKGGDELVCPAAGAEVPLEYTNTYCGELAIETNATNDSGVVVGGKAHIYFLKPSASGRIVVQPEFMEFQNIQPGSQASQEFSIRNTGMQGLTIHQFSFANLSAYLSVTAGPDLPTEIAPDTSKSWTLSVDVPATATPDQYEGFTSLDIESSAINANEGNIAIQISAGAGSAPAIDLSATSLVFTDASEQILTLHNVGDATLQVSSLSVTPASARAFYKFLIGGTDVTSNFMVQNVAKNSSLDLTVRFERPAGNTDSSVGTLQIRHNDHALNNLSEVTLLGDEGDVPIARVYPQGFTFLAADGNNEERSFVIRNIGTANLELSGTSFSFSTGSAAEFTVSDIAGTVPPGGLKSGTITFTGGNASPDVGLVVFNSNDSSGQTDIAVKALDSTAEAVAPVITPATTNDIRVGATATFNATASTPAGVGTSGLWTLLDRPAGSDVFFTLTGEELQFVPDVAGTYKIALLISSNQREAQVTYDVVVVP